MNMNKYYTIDIAGMKRDLPLCKVNEELYIGAFVIFGDVKLTEHTAAELIKRAPEHDVIITAESKGIPLAYEMARQSGKPYVIARKAPKLYMRNVVFTHVKSITTVAEQMLCLGSDEIEKMKGKRVLIVDDVISTGESIASVVQLVNQVGGEIVGKMAILAEGDAIERKDIVALAKLPLFDGQGNVIN